MITLMYRVIEDGAQSGGERYTEPSGAIELKLRRGGIGRLKKRQPRVDAVCERQGGSSCGVL